ncbi:MAG: hypothetical protein Phog2KO_27330 [Phototrophicaceae bacterium]
MSHSSELDILNEEIASHFQHLNKSLVRSLAWYVFGMVMMRHCGQTQIATLLSGLLEMPFNNVRQRLRELSYESEHKRGEKRQAIEVKSCFAPLLKWVISKFKIPPTQLVLACDATYLKDRFVILAVSVVVAGCAIPVAWHIQEGDKKGKWNPIWIDLLNHLRDAIPSGCEVYILTDSGLYSKELYQAIQKKPKWTATMRIEGGQGFFQPKGQSTWVSLKSLAHQGMLPIALEGICFKGNPLPCTLLIQWAEAYDKPCFIVSNIAITAVNHQLYGIRYWIECSFKDIKRGLFHWEQTKMTDPQRAERLWLVISIGLLWLTSVGESAFDVLHWQVLNATQTQSKRLSAPILGWIQLIVSLLKAQPFPRGYLQPYPWQSTNTYP